MVQQELLLRVLSEFAVTLVTDYDVDAIMSRLCDRIVELLGVSGAGAMLVDEHGDLRFVSASDDTVRAIERLQIELRDGPCRHSYLTGERVLVDDLRNDQRFPRFGPRALEMGMGAVYSFPMAIEQDRIGGLNLYRETAGVLDSEQAVVAQLLANMTTAYLLNGRAYNSSSTTVSQLQHALDSRIVIEQAKGKLSALNDIGVDDAFVILRGYARNNHLKLHVAAKRVVDDEVRLG